MTNKLPPSNIVPLLCTRGTPQGAVRRRTAAGRCSLGKGGVGGVREEGGGGGFSLVLRNPPPPRPPPPHRPQHLEVGQKVKYVRGIDNSARLRAEKVQVITEKIKGPVPQAAPGVYCVAVCGPPAPRQCLHLP